jgi:hypothetical protein
LFWASAAEGVLLADKINAFTEEIRALGPLHWQTNPDIDLLALGKPEDMTLKEATA